VSICKSFAAFPGWLKRVVAFSPFRVWEAGPGTRALRFFGEGSPPPELAALSYFDLRKSSG